MNMVRKIVSCIREYKKDSILSIVFIGLEVVMECFMPLIMTVLVDLFYAIEKVTMNLSYDVDIIFSTLRVNSMQEITTLLVFVSCILVVMAFASLLFGSLSAKFSAKASAGLGKNLRKKDTLIGYINIDGILISDIYSIYLDELYHIKNEKLDELINMIYNKLYYDSQKEEKKEEQAITKLRLLFRIYKEQNSKKNNNKINQI